jgi:hypothetical protein
VNATGLCFACQVCVPAVLVIVAGLHVGEALATSALQVQHTGYVSACNMSKRRPSTRLAGAAHRLCERL